MQVTIIKVEVEVEVEVKEQETRGLEVILDQVQLVMISQVCLGTFLVCEYYPMLCPKTTPLVSDEDHIMEAVQDI